MRRNKETVFVYGLMGVVLVLFAMNQNDFFTQYGPQSIFNQVITISIAALAQTFVVLTSGIDMSIGAMIGLTNGIGATIMADVVRALGSEAWGVAATIAIMIALGAAAGAVNAAAVVYGRLQPIIVTIATSSIYTGIALYVRPTPGGDVSMNFSDLATGRVFTVVPVSALIMAAVFLFFWVPFRRSRLCHAIYAVGGNEYSTYVSGIGVARTKVCAYVLSGIFSGLAGVLLTAQTASGDPLGSGLFTINSIAAVVLGGTALSGGKGGYAGSLAGAFILAMVLGLLIFWGIPSFYQNAVQGGILLFALTARNAKSLFKREAA